jgi:hypothetical protein
MMGGMISQDIFVPTQFSGCQLWLRADLGYVFGSAPGAAAYTGWQDQSGIGDPNRDFYGYPQSTPPTWNFSDPAYNNQATISFNGSQVMQMAGSLSPANVYAPFTVVLVGNEDGNTANTYIIAGDNVGGIYYMFASTSNYYALDGSTVIPTTMPRQSSPFIYIAEYNSTSSTVRINSPIVQATGNQSTGYPFERFAIGSYIAGGGNLLIGKVAEMIVYNRILAQSDINTLYNYLSIRYGIYNSIVQPTQISGLTFWLRADMGVTNSSGVTNWNDQSGTGDSNKNATSSGTAKPTLNSSNSSYNHQTTIDFNGTTNYMQTGTWTSALAQPFTSFMVGNSTSSTNAIGYDNLAAHQTSMQCNNGLFEIYAGSGLNSASGSWATAGIAVAVFNNTTSQLRFNQKTGQTAGTAGTNNITGATIGGYGAAPGNTTNSWTGSIAEIITYNRVLTQAEINNVMNYLQNRYAITNGG